MNTTRKPITVESLTAALREAVAERGEDWVYPSEWRETPLGGCLYFRDGEPACLFGLALSKHGYTSYDVREYVGIGVFLRAYAPEFIEAAGKSQILQDEGATWGEALTKYETELLRHGLLPDGVITYPTKRRDE